MMRVEIGLGGGSSFAAPESIRREVQDLGSDPGRYPAMNDEELGDPR